jgi:fatty-acyl-CoA synthase
LWIFRVLVSSRMLTLLRPDKYLGIAGVVRRQGTNATTGLAMAAVRRPNAIALIDERGRLTWAELEGRTRALAVGLTELAGGPPETVAILCRNHRGFIEALSASVRLGAHALLLNTGFSGPQMAEVMLREGARILIYDEEFAPLVALTRDQTPGLIEVLGWVDGEPTHPTLDGLISEHLGMTPAKAEREGRVVLLTSGTTGTPKGARRGGGGPAELAGMLDRIPWRAERKVVVAAPMFHAWGFGQLAIAGTMTCTVVMRRKFDPEATLALVDDHQAYGLSVVPVMLERIMDLPAEVLDRYSLASLRFVSASGSRMRSDAVLAFMDRFGEVLYNSYNATEIGQISVAGPEDLRVAPDTAGRPVRGNDLVIVDEGERPVEVGGIGRIAVRGVSPFEGYTAGDTKKSLDGPLSGHMVSGDVGRLDEAGRLYVVGRDDDMIVSGGENVYPLEVERVLTEHPDVREAVVVGVDDAAFGQRLVAYVVVADGAAPTDDDLKSHVKGRLAGYKVPRDVMFLEELPRNASGKIVARELPGR